MISTKTEHQREAKGRALASGLLLAVFLIAQVLLGAGPAHAATFAVGSTSTAGDANLSDNTCDANPLPNVTICTLPAAIQEANQLSTGDTINFAIPGNGPHTIALTDELPRITKPVTINGYSQGDSTPATTADDATPNTAQTGTNAVLKIEVRGPTVGSGSIDGLDIGASDVVVRGLVIDNCSDDGIEISGTNAVIAGNFIGTDPDGDGSLGNRLDGVNVAFTGDDATIGGTAPQARNLISGNTGTGVDVANATGANVLGNLIGTDRTGRSPLGNAFQGVRLGDSGHTVGGDAANTIAFNGGNGVQVIGTGNRILSNSIFRNDLNGVEIFNGTGNRILRNSISFNGALGIDLGADGVTANDPRDPDTGANNLQNRPVITSAVTTGGSTTIRGRLNSTPRKTFNIQFFATCCEGEPFLVGQKQVTTSKRGAVSFVFVPDQAVVDESGVVATATNAGSTSEFSNTATVN